MNSDKSVHEFCKSRGISETYFYKQRRELLGGPQEHRKAVVEDFVSLPLTTSTLDVELSLGEGVVLRIRRG